MANKSGVLSSSVRQVEIVETPVGCFNELSFCFGRMSQISRDKANAFGTAVANILVPPEVLSVPEVPSTASAVVPSVPSVPATASAEVPSIPEKAVVLVVPEKAVVPVVPAVPAVPSAQDVQVAERAVSVSSILKSAPPLPDSPATDAQDTPPPNKTPLEPSPLHTSQESRKPNHRRHR